MGHKDKGCAGLGHHFLEEQPLPAKERERELVMGQRQTSSNTSVHISVTTSPPTPNHKAHLRSNESSLYPSLDIFKASQFYFLSSRGENAESWLLLQSNLPLFLRRFNLSQKKSSACGLVGAWPC